MRKETVYRVRRAGTLEICRWKRTADGIHRHGDSYSVHPKYTPLCVRDAVLGVPHIFGDIKHHHHRRGKVAAN